LFLQGPIGGNLDSILKLDPTKFTSEHSAIRKTIKERIRECDPNTPEIPSNF